MSQQNTFLALPPNEENEALVLVNAIKSKEHREVFVRKLTYTKFRTKEFRSIAWGILEAVRDGMDINVDAILLKSKTCPERQSVTFNYLSQLLTNFEEVPASNFLSHVETLITDSVKASIIDAMFSSLYQTCLNPTSKIGDIQERISYLGGILESGLSGSRLEFKDLNTVATEFEAYKERSEEKWTCGFRDLDEYLTFGLKPGTLSVTAGLSSMGKSSMALSMMKNLANNNVATAQFALEMDSMQLFSKLLAFNARLPISTILRKNDKMSDSERQAIQYELQRLRDNKRIFLNDQPTQSLKTIREQIMLLQDYLKEEYIVVIIDLFGKIADFQSSDNFARDYEKKVNDVQKIVRELGVHINLVAQIRRDVAHRKNKRPTMADLKNAGALTEGADIIFGIHRPFYDPELALKTRLNYGKYNEDEEGETEDFVQSDPNENIAEVIILKQRMGINNVLVNFEFDPDTTCFRPINDEYQKILNQEKFNEE